ncbi:MAG: protein kinase [Candidatus Brocadiae bacterium]|nr:protein kinase [Candidatus Brocadiia bacterium]
MAVLKLERGVGAGTAYFIENEATIGRDASQSTIQICDQKASRSHAKILKEENHYYLEDLESKNGTFLNGKPVTGKEALEPGDYIRIGFTWFYFCEDQEIERISKQLPAYEILQEIKRIGGSCLCFKVLQTGLGRMATLNLLPPNIIRKNPQLKERFRQQVRAFAKLNHENISIILDFDSKESYLYFTTEYLEGETLASLLAKENKLSLEKTIEIGIGIARALNHAHNQHVIHQDVTPFNVGIGNRRVILGGFGLASVFDEIKDSFSGLIEKTEYLSPEQIQKQKIDQKSDIYSLGAILYECLAGRPPFSGENPEDIANFILNDTAPAITMYNPNVPAEIEDMIYRCLEKDPAQRPENAEEIANKLEEVLLRYRVLELKNKPDIYTSGTVYYLLQILENPFFVWCFFPSLSLIFLAILSFMMYTK